MTFVGVCERCGFDRSRWTDQDAHRTLAHAPELLARWCEGATPRLEAMLRARRIDDLKAIQAASDPFDKVHHLWHGLVSIADVRRAGGDFVRTQSGSVIRINASTGGVPKESVGPAEIGVDGVVGDVQAARVHHGRPWQALCLWSRDVIDGLVADGHPIAPGAAGENVTIAGVDWSALRAGAIVDIGDVRCQLSAPAVPCAKNARWFVDGDISLIDHDLHPGAARWYASVLTPGRVSPGDPVVVGPAARSGD